MSVHKDKWWCTTNLLTVDAIPHCLAIPDLILRYTITESTIRKTPMSKAIPLAARLCIELYLVVLTQY